MLFKGIITQASGSIGGVTASRNRGGMYFRGRAIPVNPNTDQQGEVRGFLTTLSSKWKELSQAERSAWDTYAFNTPVVNALGDSVKLSGFNWYVSTNTLRLQAGYQINDNAPTTFGLATSGPVTCSANNVGLQQVSISFDNAEAWANDPDNALAVFLSRPQNAGIGFFKGPYRFAGLIQGALTPPASPQTINVPFPVVAGQKIFGYARSTMLDGRFSGKVEFSRLLT